MKSAIVLAALFLLACPASAQVGGPGEPTNIVDAFHAALRGGHQQDAAALLADDALIFEEGGAERSKAEYVAKHLPADAAFSKSVASKVTRRASGIDGTFAWVASEGRVTGTYKGEAVNRATTESMLLRRYGADWKIVHIHWSSAAAR